MQITNNEVNRRVALAAMRSMLNNKSDKPIDPRLPAAIETIFSNSRIEGDFWVVIANVFAANLDFLLVLTNTATMLYQTHGRELVEVGLGKRDEV